jgi:hypothetical protein
VSDFPDLPDPCPPEGCVTINAPPIDAAPIEGTPLPYYPGFDLQDEPGLPSTPPAPGRPIAPAGGPGAPPLRLAPLPAPKAPAPSGSPDAPVYHPRYNPDLLSEVQVDRPPFGFSDLPKPSLADPQFSFGRTLGDIPGYVDLSGGLLPAEPPPFAQEFPTFASAVSPGQLALFETPVTVEAPAATSLLGSLSGVLGDVFDVGTFVNRAVTTVLSLGAVGRILNPITLLMQTTEAGLPPGTEEANVIRNLLGFVPTAQRIPVPPPIPIGDDTGLPPLAVESPPATEFQTVVVSAPRATTPVLADPLVGLSPVVLGIGALPELGALTVPAGNRAPKVGPSPREQSPVLTRPAIPTEPFTPTRPVRPTQPIQSVRPSHGTGLRTSPQPKPSPSPDPLNPGSTKQCQESKPKKKQQKKQPRGVCYRGTYVELRSGLIKHRKERIACR